MVLGFACTLLLSSLKKCVMELLLQDLSNSDWQGKQNNFANSQRKINKTFRQKAHQTQWSTVTFQYNLILASFCLLWGLNNDMKWRIQLFFLDFNDWIIRKINKIKIHKNSLKNESWSLKLFNVTHSYLGRVAQLHDCLFSSFLCMTQKVSLHTYSCNKR